MKYEKCRNLCSTIGVLGVVAVGVTATVLLVMAVVVVGNKGKMCTLDSRSLTIH